MVFRVLVVCVANRGRSATLKVFLNRLLRHKGMKNIVVDSAGTDEQRIKDFIKRGDTGANHFMTYIMQREGYQEIMDHRMKPVDKKLVAENNLILVFTTQIRKTILDKYPGAKGKVMTVRGFLTGKEADLPPDALDVDDAHQPKAGLYRGRIEPRTLKAHYHVAKEMKRIAVKLVKKFEDLGFAG